MSPVKRSIMLHGRKTSVSLEQPFWHAVQTIANERSVAAGALIAEIDSAREEGYNLSSAIRTFVLAYYVSRDEQRSWTSPRVESPLQRIGRLKRHDKA